MRAVGASRKSNANEATPRSRAVPQRRTSAVVARFAGPARSGTEYMARLRARNDHHEVSAQAKARAVEDFKDAFAGLFMRFQAEERRIPTDALLSFIF